MSDIPYGCARRDAKGFQGRFGARNPPYRRKERGIGYSAKLAPAKEGEKTRDDDERVWSLVNNNNDGDFSAKLSWGQLVTLGSKSILSYREIL